ncbi:hypothetical protein TUMEXPCC7403_06530 [Tumidithrix helvetica PCC 7403]|uniref:hypothetical protein n=1 Tax=Tumidithrix helvetica TaxID=3457545 RepID=UPI003CA79D3D
MYIKIKGVFIRVILLIQLAVLLLGYSFLGYYLNNLYRGQQFLEGLLLLSISLGATWAIAFNLGGLIAVAVTALIAFFYAGLVPSLIATGAGGAFLFFCLWGDDYEAPDRKDENLNKLDWLVTITTIAFAAIFAVLVLNTVPNVWIAYLLAGGMTGALATVGMQTKSVNLTRWKTFLLLIGLALVGMAIGVIFESIWFSFTFHRPS